MHWYRRITQIDQDFVNTATNNSNPIHYYKPLVLTKFLKDTSTNLHKILEKNPRKFQRILQFQDVSLFYMTHPTDDCGCYLSWVNMKNTREGL